MGRPLEIDGEVGSLTWGALFGASTVPSNSMAPSPLAKAAIDFAITQIGVMEKPMGSNRGPEVDDYLRTAGLNPVGESFPWCVAFTHFCYKKAAENLGLQTRISRLQECLIIGIKRERSPRLCA